MLWKGIRILVLFSLLALMSGCYSGYHITKAPSDSKSVNRTYSVAGDKSPVLFVSGVNVKNSNATEGFDKRFLGKLNETGLFKEVVYGVYSRKPEPPYLDVKLNVEETSDPHSGGNAVKGFFTGFTFFLLAPALPLVADYSAEYTLEVVWPNTQRRQYSASCAGDAYGTIFQAREAFQKMPGEVTDACLISVINQMGADYFRSFR